MTGLAFCDIFIVAWRRRYLYELLREKRLLPRRQEAEWALGLIGSYRPVEIILLPAVACVHPAPRKSGAS